jgi:hypothetical protein
MFLGYNLLHRMMVYLTQGVAELASNVVIFRCTSDWLTLNSLLLQVILK